MNSQTFILQGQILEELHSNHMDIEKNQTFSQGVKVLDVYECRHQKHYKQCATCLENHWAELLEKATPYEVTCNSSEVVGADIFFVKMKTLLYIVDYYSMFSIVKGADSLAANDLVKTAKIVFTEFGFPKKIISDADMNFTSQWFRQFCRQINIQQAITSSYLHQSNGYVEECIK